MMPVKIHCGCGQRYAFDIEPFCGRMPFPVTCPVCGADGTGAANEVIAFNLATDLSAHHGGRERMMLLAVLGCLMAGMVGVIKASTMASGLDVPVVPVGFGVGVRCGDWRLFLETCQSFAWIGQKKRTSNRPARSDKSKGPGLDLIGGRFQILRQAGQPPAGRFGETTLLVNIRRIKRNNFSLRKEPSSGAWPAYDPQEPVQPGLLTFKRTHPV